MDSWSEIVVVVGEFLYLYESHWELYECANVYYMQTEGFENDGES
jgi:hypothetical protein